MRRVGRPTAGDEPSKLVTIRLEREVSGRHRSDSAAFVFVIRQTT